MNRRVILLLFLLAGTLLYRGLDFYLDFFSDHVRPGISTDIQNGQLIVGAMAATDLAGRPSPAAAAGLKLKDELHAIYNASGQGGAIHSKADYSDVLRTIRAEESWSLVIARDGKEQKIVIAPQQPDHAYFRRFGLKYLVPLVTIATAFFIGFMKPKDDNAFLACLLFLSFSSLFWAFFEMYPKGFAEPLELFHRSLNAFSIFLFALFFLRFPSPSVIDRKAPWLKYALLIGTVLSWSLEISSVIAAYHSLASYESLDRMMQKFDLFPRVLALGTMGIGLLSLVLNTIGAKSPNEKRRMSILLGGTAIGVLPLIVLMCFIKLKDLQPPLWAIVVVVISLSLFPLSFVYVVLKHRVLGIRLIVRRGLQYALVSRGYKLIEASFIFLVLYLISNPILMHWFPNISPFGIAIYSVFVTLAVTSALPKINRPIMLAIDRRFFRDAYNAQQILTDLSRAVSQMAAQPERLMETVADRISDSLHSDQTAIFVRASLRSVSGSNGGAMILSREMNDGDYRCIHYKTKHPSIRVDPQQNLLLPENAVLARHLKDVSAEPEAMEIFLDDPKSWSKSLVRVDPQTRSLQKERDLFERLNTRLIVPLVNNNRVLGFFSLGEKLSEEAYSKEDKELLLTVAQQTAIALDYVQLIEQAKEQEKLRREIEIAQQVQAQLFPQQQPVMKTLDYTGLCKSARGVGGDYYDFLPLGEGKLGIALGDISGKGISAALLMASLQALLRSHAPLHMSQVDALVSDINRLMCSSTARGKYATFFYGFYDDVHRTLTYLNAGHIPPMLFRVDAGTEPMRLKTGGMVVGMFPEAKYQMETVQMQPGDILFLYSDGVSEAMNATEEEFGEERIVSLIGQNRNLPTMQLRELILAQTAEFVGAASQHDDFTFVAARVI